MKRTSKALGLGMGAVAGSVGPAVLAADPADAAPLPACNQYYTGYKLCLDTDFAPGDPYMRVQYYPSPDYGQQDPLWGFFYITGPNKYNISSPAEIINCGYCSHTWQIAAGKPAGTGVYCGHLYDINLNRDHVDPVCANL
jgi:hypothetical protein